MGPGMCYLLVCVNEAKSKVVVMLVFSGCFSSNFQNGLYITRSSLYGK